MKPSKLLLLQALLLLLVSSFTFSAPSRLSMPKGNGRTVAPHSYAPSDDSLEQQQTNVDAAATSFEDAIFKRMENGRGGRGRRNNNAADSIPVRLIWTPEQALQGISGLNPMATVNFVFETGYEERAIAFVARMNERLAALEVPPRHTIKVYYKTYHRTTFRAVVEATAQVSATR